jgi:hypothetical protein
MVQEKGTVYKLIEIFSVEYSMAFSLRNIITAGLKTSDNFI